MKPELIVMLTHDDLTVENAYEVFEACSHTRALYWGFKEQPLPLPEMQRIYRRMKECGKRTVLEVVAYTEAEGLEGAQMAAACGCDILMGTCFHESILHFCQEHGIAYMPFVGQISGRPSVLEGSVEDMVAEAERLKSLGVFGIDLLGYRYQSPQVPTRVEADAEADADADADAEADAEAEAERLIREIVAHSCLPVCVAGSINCHKRLDVIKSVQPWAFTVGSALFDHKFGDTLADQIEQICDVIMQKGN